MAAMPSSLLRRAVKRSAAAADRIRPRRRGVVALIYHRVGGRSGLEVDLPPDLFEAQIALLARDYRAATLDQALTELAGPAPADRDPVVVTFDDGTADFVDVALPVLERHRVPVVLYVATDFVEQGRPFPDDGPACSWAALRDALTTGLVTVGSHTHTHALLDRLSPAEADAEIGRSIELIGERLDVSAEHFAYPKAVPGSPAAEPHRLARSPIQLADGTRWFRRKVDGGMTLEDDLRRVLDRRRYAGTTT
jgi:peptidoglycan/xylan/chitin deacetylase (PgdA/CDA1 family)